MGTGGGSSWIMVLPTGHRGERSDQHPEKAGIQKGPMRLGDATLRLRSTPPVACSFLFAGKCRGSATPEPSKACDGRGARGGRSRAGRGISRLPVLEFKANGILECVHNFEDSLSATFGRVHEFVFGQLH